MAKIKIKLQLVEEKDACRIRKIAEYAYTGTGLQLYMRRRRRPLSQKWQRYRTKQRCREIGVNVKKMRRDGKGDMLPRSTVGRKSSASCWRIWTKKVNTEDHSHIPHKYECSEHRGEGATAVSKETKLAEARVQERSLKVELPKREVAQLLLTSRKYQLGKLHYEGEDKGATVLQLLGARTPHGQTVHGRSQSVRCVPEVWGEGPQGDGL